MVNAIAEVERIVIVLESELQGLSFLLYCSSINKIVNFQCLALHEQECRLTSPYPWENVVVNYVPAWAIVASSQTGKGHRDFNLCKLLLLSHNIHIPSIYCFFLVNTSQVLFLIRGNL